MAAKTKGRPLKFKSAKKLQSKVNDYFESCFENEPFSIVGLALYLDTTTETLRDYEQNRGPAFSAIIRKAKMRVEKYWGDRCTHQAVAGAIFQLKCNHGYVERQVIEHDVGGNLKKIFDNIDGDSKGPVDAS